MTTQAQVSAQIVNALALSEPHLDTSIGSPARKIIDAVAASQAEATVDTMLTSYTYDIDSKSGGDLDDFVALFGLSRLPAQRATGVVTFSRDTATAATKIATVGSGAQVMAMTSPNIFVQTLASAVLALGQASVDVPVQAINPGPSGNVGSGTLTSLASTIDGVTAVTNASALSNGVVAETDDALRARFKTSALRNLAGTDAMYRGMALQIQADPSDPDSRAVSQVNVLGSKKTWTEQIAVASGTATSTITDAAFIYPLSVYVGANISQGDFLTPNQYTLAINNSVNPATLSVTQVGTNMPDGLYDLQFDYVPTYSRNDPLSTRWGGSGANITNRVDVWVNGLVVGAATQTCVFSTANKFNATAHDPLLNTRFAKLNGVAPASGDFFVPLGFGPVTSVPTTLTIAATVYTLGTHYDIVQQNDAFGYAANSKFGLVFYQAGAVPSNGAVWTMDYSYNSVPGTIQQSVESTWRLLGTDVWYHAGKSIGFRFNLAVIYDRTYDQASVNTNINTALATFINNLGFNSSMYVVDILQTIANVPGVVNVRFLASGDDGTNYAIQARIPGGSTYTAPYETGGRAVDINFDDATYPLFDSVRIIVKAANTFGTP